MKKILIVIFAVASLLIVACTAPGQITGTTDSSLTENIVNVATDIADDSISDAVGDTIDGIPIAEFDSYSIEDVASHSTEEDCWIVLENKIYDVTVWIQKHPGGKDAISNWCGKVGFEDAYRGQHGTYQDEKMEVETSMIGVLES